MGARATAYAQRSCGPCFRSEEAIFSLASENGRQKKLHNSHSPYSLQIGRQGYLGCQWRSTSLKNSTSEHRGGYRRTDITVGRRKKSTSSIVTSAFRDSSSEYSSETSTDATVSAKQENTGATPFSAPDSVVASENGSTASDVDSRPNAHPVVLGAMTEYVIRVNAEMMGVFKYVEKLKRARIKDLADALLQVALACTLFTGVRGLLIPLIEIFQSHPPNWSKAVLMLAGLDYFAVAYLAFKAREPMMQAIQMAVVPNEGLEVLERQEEVMVTMLVELVKLFKRMRNVLLVVAFTQAAQAVYGVYVIKDPNFVGNVTAVIKTWVIAPWN